MCVKSSLLFKPKHRMSFGVFPVILLIQLVCPFWHVHLRSDVSIMYISCMATRTATHARVHELDQNSWTLPYLVLHAVPQLTSNNHHCTRLKHACAYITKSHAAVPVGDNPDAAVAVAPDAAVAVAPVAPLAVEAPHLHSHMLELPQMCNELPHMLNKLLN